MKLRELIIFLLCLMGICTNSKFYPHILRYKNTEIKEAVMFLNEPFTIKLPENIELTDLEWYYDQSSDDDVIFIDEDEFPPKSGDAMGRRVFTFEITELGQKSLKFHLAYQDALKNPVQSKEYHIACILPLIVVTG